MDINEIERSALHDAPLPEHLDAPEQAAYISFRGLYHDWRAGIVSKDRAKSEKKQILQTYDNLSRWRDIYMDNMRRWNRAEYLMPDVERSKTRCPTCDRARQIIRVLDGRDNITAEFKPPEE